MNDKTGFVLIAVGLGFGVLIYLMLHKLQGPPIPNGANTPGGGGAPGTGPASHCGATICLGTEAQTGLDGSSDPVSVTPAAQTEAAYNVSPTDYSDATGDDTNDEGSDVIFA